MISTPHRFPKGKPRDINSIKRTAEVFKNALKNDPNGILAQVLQAENGYSEQYKNYQQENKVPTKGQMFKQYKSTLEKPELDKEQMKNMQDASLGNMLGKALGAMFGTYATRQGADVPFIQDTAGGQLLGSMQQMDQQHALDLQRYQDNMQAIDNANNELYNKDVILKREEQLKRDISKQDNEAAYRKAKLQAQAEIDELKQKNRNTLMQEMTKVGLPPDPDNPETLKAFHEIKTRMIESEIYKNYKTGTASDEDDLSSMNEEEMAVYKYITDVAIPDLERRLEQARNDKNELGEQSNPELVESLQEELNSLKNNKPTKHTIAIFKPEYDKWYTNQVQYAEDFQIIADYIKENQSNLTQVQKVLIKSVQEKLKNNEIDTAKAIQILNDNILPK